MQRLFERSPRRLAVILGVTLVVCLPMWSLEMTPWAEGIRASLPQTEDIRRNLSPILRAMLPFLKELVMIGVPMITVLGILKLLNRF